MIVRALHHIKAEDALAKLFNEYMRCLSTPDLVAAPRQSMHKFRKQYDRACQPTTKKHTLTHQVFSYYHLSVLSNSFDLLHNNVTKAVNTLESFFELYGEDLHGFAFKNRMRMLDEYGSDEDDDFYDAGEKDEEGEIVWAVVPKHDAESLRHYTLYEELRSFFKGEYEGEHIGSSSPEDFASLSNIVEQQSAFSFRRMIEAMSGKPANIVTVQDDGSTEPVSLGQHIEDEINEDLRGSQVAQLLNGVLLQGRHAFAFFKKMRPEELADYHALHALLLAMRNVTTTPSPF